jgi:hypothetical protein
MFNKIPKLKSSVKKLSLFTAGSIIFSLLQFSFPSPANSATLVDCLYVSQASFSNSSWSKTYKVTINSYCDSKTTDKLNWTSISFYPDKSILNGISQTYYANSWGTTMEFSISSWDYKRLKPGVQYPYLKIFSPSDFTYKTISLPTFLVQDPLECVSVSRSGASSIVGYVSYDLTLVNDCSGLGDGDFDDLKYSISIPGYSAYISSKTLYSLSSYGSNLSFSLPGILKGTYFPTLQISDGSYNSRKININSFTVQGSGQSSANNSGGTALRNCIYSSNIDTQCDSHPNFIFEMCSSLKSGTLQEKVGTKWVTLWKVTGKKDLSSCESKWPYLVSITGTNNSKSSTSMRIIYSGTSALSGYTQLMTLKAVK